MSRWLPALLLLPLCASGATAQSPAQSTSIYRPPMAVPETLEPFLKHLDAGSDGFTAERDARLVERRLGELSRRLRAARTGAPPLADWLLAPDFRGGRLQNAGASSASAVLDVQHSRDLPGTTVLNARGFEAELARLVGSVRAVDVAEFLVTSIEAGPPADGVLTDVRYDLVGGGATAGRVQHVGVWRMRWRPDASGWRIVEWTALSHHASVATRPIFTEITVPALGGNDSFRQQLETGLDAWMATIDSVLTRDSNGHHGVSVGDADGDGLEDLYVAQPAGLPNRLYRARGDATFEDVTERAGLAVLDDTAQSLFADVDNDGDQDLVLTTGTRLLLFANDGTGRFAPVADAFRTDRPLQGVLTSMAMADYDRDGFLDLYVCVYSYFFGAGDDKAGTPAPYYNARNGPPGALFRNDGRGRFVESTKAAGLDEGNDRYHFAAAWADYDNDGWPDLLVANDFGTKNLYRNRGSRGGVVTFEDVAAAAGVLDHGAGMSAAFVDYDNDGLLDIYTGNMWSAAGLRVTASPAFMPDAPAQVRALYRRHARGNSLFRNRGDGTFDDTTLAARAQMGRWAWASDALDFDSDGWEDLYVVNGMLSRDTGPDDLEGFFWRQVVARSPLTRVKGTLYDDAWRAINQLLIHSSIASRQRNVLLRNDGHGGFDDVSGAVGLDLDQDGRSFAVFDADLDGDPDVAVMAARQAPQLRLFRNDFPRALAGEDQRASLVVGLVGTASNRDAIGARVIVETERLRRTKIVQAGSGFLSQHSKALHIGLGASQRVKTLTIQWPSGRAQVFHDVPVNTRVRLVEGSALDSQPFVPASSTAATPPATPVEATRPPLLRPGTWMYEPFPMPDLSGAAPPGQVWPMEQLRGRPAIVLLWSGQTAVSRAALDALGRARDALREAGIGALAIELDAPADRRAVRAPRPDGLPVVVASQMAGTALAILHRHLFMNRQHLQLPTVWLLDASGQVVVVYRDGLDPAAVVGDAARIDATPAQRLARAVPFPGTLYSPPPRRNYLPYGRELQDQGIESAAVSAFELAAQASPNAFTLYRLGSLLSRRGDAARARTALERALALQPDLAEAHNDVGALLAAEGDLEAAMTHFRAALAAAPEYPDALNNLGYALLLSGRDAEARGLYERALALQPDFPEALNNLGLLVGRAGDLDQAERHFRAALAQRPAHGEAANNLALVLVARGAPDAAIRLLEDLLAATPSFESAYVTLAKIHFNAGRVREGLGALERLLQRNPTHPVALELQRQFRPR